MKLAHRLKALLLVATLTATTAAAQEGAPVTVEETEGTIVLDNGILKLTLDKELGQVVSVEYQHDGETVQLAREGEGLYFDVNGGPTEDQGELEERRPRAGYTRPKQYLNEIRVTEDGPDVGEVAVSAGPAQWMPFEVEYRIRLPRGASGFYAWAAFRHGEGMPAAYIDQTRFVIKAPTGYDTLTHYVVDDSRVEKRPTSPIVGRLQDATDLLEDGTVTTKYNLSAFTHDYLAHGMAGDEVGLWVLYPSAESFNGGPLRQDLTVHEDNILLAMFQSRHFGAAPVKVEADETWNHLYGPVMFYVNAGEGPQAMHADAKVKALAERKEWPYEWLDHPQYAQERGTVSGEVQMSNGDFPAGSWVVLGPAEEGDWTEQSGGNFYWTKVGLDGVFTLPKVSPGTYHLSVSGGNQPEDLRVENVTVSANETTDIGKLYWVPKSYGETLWQIGRFDRSALEYHDGEPRYYRDYDAFFRYQQRMPNDVHYVIGRSRENPHWYFSQWSWYNTTPYWTIEFNLDEAPQGEATLTLGLAAVRPAGALQVKVNGEEIAALKMPKSGAAGYRSGAQDSRYTLERLTFDASLLKEGVNQITLGHTEAEPFPTDKTAAREAGRPRGEVMYDALRLEVQPAAEEN